MNRLEYIFSLLESCHCWCTKMVYQVIESTEINAIELSLAMDTIHPLTRVSFCSAGSIKASMGIECTAQDATYFPSLQVLYFFSAVWIDCSFVLLH